jgi:DNA-binding LacI/PurR family transcriptional regulator
MSRESVIRRIVERETQGRALTEEAVLDDASALYRAACEVFGTWDTALHYAGVRRRCRGIEPSTPEEVIRKIRRYLRTNHRAMGTFVRRHHYRLHRDAIECFGTWRKALSAAGVDIRRAGLNKTKRRQWTNEEIIDALRAWHAAGHSMAWGVVCLENRMLAAAARGRFNGWRRALLAAGLPPEIISPARRSIWNPPRVLERIRRRHEKGKRLDENVVGHEACGLLKAAREHFGSWSEALAAAGVDPRQHVVRDAGQQDGPLGDAEADDGEGHKR